MEHDKILVQLLYNKLALWVNMQIELKSGPHPPWRKELRSDWTDCVARPKDRQLTRDGRFRVFQEDEAAGFEWPLAALGTGWELVAEMSFDSFLRHWCLSTTHPFSSSKSSTGMVRLSRPAI